MKVKYKANEKLEFEVEGSGQKELFKELSAIQEIFGEECCGMCKHTGIKFAVRNVEGNDYFELKCSKCGATLSFGQHKKGGTLFPKRKNESGDYMPNNGWYKWEPNKK